MIIGKRRNRGMKLTKKIERLYKEGKCRECSVLVTRMDFAKILGKFTKVKIQYETTSPKNKPKSTPTSPTSRLKNNENGMVLIHRNAYKEHPVKQLGTPTNKESPKRKESKLGKSKQRVQSSPHQNKNNNNILKEINRLKKPSLSTLNRKNNSNSKRYGIIFSNPRKKKNNDLTIKTTLKELLPNINNTILPSNEWSVEYLPTQLSDEPKNDKIYDKIAAELEDLMNNETSVKSTAEKTDDFPSILDILNDNSSDSSSNKNNQSTAAAPTSLESCDVEAMLLGNKIPQSESAQADKSESEPKNNVSDTFENPHSPSILDETLQKGIEEHLPPDDSKTIIKSTEKPADEPKTNINYDAITHIVFKINKDGKCLKSVKCPKNLKYDVEIDGKTIEFIGAPKFICSLEDLQVLLQIVNESELSSLYVLCN